MKNWSTVKTEVKLPSNRRKEIQEMSKTLRNNQNLRRLVSDECRKTTYSHNRWRDSAGKVINTMKGEEEPLITYSSTTNKEKCLKSANRVRRISQRAKASYKYQRKQKEMFEKSLSKYLQFGNNSRNRY